MSNRGWHYKDKWTSKPLRGSLQSSSGCFSVRFSAMRTNSLSWRQMTQPYWEPLDGVTAFEGKFHTLNSFVGWYRGNWRLCELHKYYVKRNNSLFSLARYTETGLVTGAVRDGYSSVSATINPRCQRQLLLVDSEVRMTLEAWSAGLYLVPKPIAWSVIG